MGRGAGAPRIGGTPKSYQTTPPVQVQLNPSFHTFGVRFTLSFEGRLAAAFTAAARLPNPNFSTGDEILFSRPKHWRVLPLRSEVIRFPVFCLRVPQVPPRPERIKGGVLHLDSWLSACGLSTAECLFATLLCALCVTVPLCFRPPLQLQGRFMPYVILKTYN